MVKLNAGKPFTARVVLLDLDGTLIDTAPDLAGAANHVLQKLGLSLIHI